MKLHLGSYEVRNPVTHIQVVGIVLLMFASLYSGLAIFRMHYPILTYLLVAWLIGCLGYLGYIMKMMKQQSRVLAFDGDTIILQGQRYCAKDIEQVTIMDGYKRAVGIKPRGKRLIPVGMSFSFVQGEPEGLKALQEWAESNHVKVRNGNFFRFV
jgi:hypothetical protein